MGIKGYGEAPAISYYNIPVEKMAEDLERKKVFVEKFAFSDPERYWHYLHHLFPANPFSLYWIWPAGIFMAEKENSYMNYGGLDTATAPLTDYTIAIDSIEKR